MNLHGDNQRRARRMLFVWRGLSLGHWIRLLGRRPGIDVSGLAAAASVFLTAPLNSLLSSVESIVWRRRVDRVRLHESPIFILGHWRSGTSLLHNLLALDPQFAFVNLYQALYPGHFLLSERWATRLTARFLPATRPMDNMPCRWDLPQEDETAMMLLTLCSPYLSVVFPTDRDKYSRFEDLKHGLTERELQQWQQAFVWLLRKVACRQGRSRIVLKSPPHTGRIPILRQLFPKACYIHIVRNPYEVYASTLRLRRVMACINGLSRTQPADLEEQVLDGYMRMYQAYHMHRALIDRSHLHETRYEDLVADPVGSIERIYKQFQLSGFEEVRPMLDSELEQHHGHQTGTRSLSPEEQQRVYERWAPAFRRYGYARETDGVPSLS